MRTRELYIKHRERIKKQRAEWYAANREEIRRKRKESYDPVKQRWQSIKRRYGLTREQVEVMLSSQSGRCPICKTGIAEDYRIDHSHHTYKVRGLLCHDCNIGIGNFKDDADRLIAAAVYLTYESGNK